MLERFSPNNRAIDMNYSILSKNAKGDPSNDLQSQIHYGHAEEQALAKE